MASTATSFTNRPKLDHSIPTIVSDQIPPNTYSRTVCAGKSILGSFKVDNYWTENIGDRKLKVQEVNTFEEYISGCPEHEKCLGHFCITPRGTVLLPQRMATTLGIMSNEYAKMAEAVFTRDTQSQEVAYREKLRTLMLGKSGKMRGDMVAGPVDSSAREVISLSWKLPLQHFAVPRMVAENMRVLRVSKDEETGIELGYYTEDCLREGDRIIAVRPPSLWQGNVQGFTVMLWNHECFGLNPSHADEFHADHDGDEMQIYFLAKEESHKQCEEWKPINPCKFTKAINTTKLPESATKCYSDIRETFMMHSTVSIKELLEGEKLPPISKAARMKEPMANMFIERMKNPEKVFEDFSSESIRGIKDVMAQQLNQGYLGDMSRQARVSASCIKYKGRGVFHIRSCTETIKILCPPIQDITKDSKYPLGGNSCMRAISALCSVAQQAALDSHRVSQDVSSAMDLINNIIVGGKESLIVISSGFLPPHSWKYEVGDISYCIVNNESAKSYALRVIAAYSPIILKAVKLMNGDVRTVCKNGISVICNYYSVKLSKLELYSLVELLCYRCDAYNEPITTKRGLEKRDMRWMAVVFANHYGKLQNLEQKGKTKRAVRPETITEAVSFCNFDYMQ